MSPKENSNPNNLDNMEGVFKFDNVYQSFLQFVTEVKDSLRQFLKGTQVSEIFEIFCKMLKESCLLKVVLGGFLVLSFIPVFAFCVFAVLSLIATITGFLLLEGALLFLGGFLALLWVGGVGVLFLCIAGLAAILYLVYTNAEHLAFKIERILFWQGSGNAGDNVVVVNANHQH